MIRKLTPCLTRLRATSNPLGPAVANQPHNTATGQREPLALSHTTTDENVHLSAGFPPLRETMGRAGAIVDGWPGSERVQPKVIVHC